MRGLGQSAAVVVLIAVACTSEATPAPTITPTPTPMATPTLPPTSCVETLREARQKLQETYTLLVRMTYPTGPDQEPNDYERIRVEYTRDMYHIIGESYEGESYYYPAGGWACWSTDIGPMGGEGDVQKDWDVKEIPREEPVNLIESRFAPMLEAAYPFLNPMKHLLEDGREYYKIYNVRVPGSVLGGDEISRVGSSVFVDVETRSARRWSTFVVRGSQPGRHTTDFLEYDSELSIEMPCEP